MKTNSSFHAAGEVATQPAWGTGEQAAQPLNGSTSRFAMSESSLADLLQKAASQYPNRAAYKFIDYDTDPAGFTETVTWWQVHRRAMIVAEELWIYASSGDRVAILAPQGLEYIIAFMGVLQAGLIAVPLPVPQFGIHDERISSALRDSAPSIILTTSSVIDEVTTYAPHACAAQGQSAPIVVAVDALDLSSSRALDPTRFERPSTAYLQYTSGSTRAPAGVVLSHCAIGFSRRGWPKPRNSCPRRLESRLEATNRWVVTHSHTLRIRLVPRVRRRRRFIGTPTR